MKSRFEKQESKEGEESSFANISKAITENRYDLSVIYKDNFEQED